MRNPDVYRVRQIKIWDVSEQRKNGEYFPARPLPFYGCRLFENLKLAYLVFIGRYDILDWEDYDRSKSIIK